ncbi:MAG TPA: hypothetical protein VJ932_09530, partial [Alkalispirochaeta sp.]|nr:hypothetical protein [Alkalispirochaeta sp.]
MNSTVTPNGDRFFSIVVEPDGPGTAVLALLDEELTGVTEQEVAPLSFDSRMFTRIDGSVQVGSLIYNPVSGEVRNGPGPTGNLQPIAHDATNYWVIRTESEFQISFDRYSDSFVPGPSWTAPADGVIPAEAIRDVMMHERAPSLGASDEYVAFLLTGSGLRRTVLTDSDFAAESGFPIDTSTGIGSQILPVGSFDAVRETPE